MFKQIMKWSSALVMGAVMLSGAAEAAAWRTCNGKPVKWESGHFGTVRNRCSIADSGDVNASYWNAISQWQSISGVINSTSTWPADRCYITHGDGYNDVALVNRSNIDGNHGLTILQLDGCTWSWSTQYIDEADAMVSNDMSFHNPDESQWTDTTSGRVTFLHELGHAHGLQHSDNFGIMCTHQARPYVGGTGDHVSVLSDDDWGIRQLYPSNSYRNLFASAQKMNGTSATTFNVGTTINVCRNQPLSIGFTFGATGNSGADGFRIRMSMANQPPPSGFTGGYDLGYWNGWVSADGVYSSYYSVTVPNVPTGIYWIYFRVDDNSLFSESREYDNVTHSPMTLNVQNCWY